jgi:hypothetical protein
MSDTIKLQVRRVKNQFGKLSGTWQAVFGPFTSYGTSRDEAQLILSERLNEVEHNAFKRRYLVTAKGTVFALFHVFGGWCYDIVHRDGSSSSCMLSTESEREAFDSMKRHFDGYSE